MSTLTNKIDFALVFTVRNANPNGDPLGGNRPRTTLEGLGEVSDVCLKRKLRNRLMDEGQSIFVQSDGRRAKGDTFRSLEERADSIEELYNMRPKKKGNSKAKGKAKEKVESPEWTEEDYAKLACATWYDVRAFGQVFAFKKMENKETDSLSVGVRGPVSIQPTFSVKPVEITSMQITKSTNLQTQTEDNSDKKGSDTMGTKHRVDFGVYVTYGSVSAQLAKYTEFSDEDALLLKEALRTLFRNDESAARPAGSMEVVKLVWWQHNCPNGQYSSAKVHRTLHVSSDETETVSVYTEDLPGLTPEVLDGE
ncbi:MAG: type I-C CRISPR-associated protein Cas7/Csd2 [Clostridiales bacterium]|nr:type I-C CRISPR-associated protein Cas7/Csd2 [Clostridiales bacterium]